VTRVERSAIIAHPAARLYRLVAEVERYPEFLPWCSRATETAESEDLTRATLEIDFHGIRQSFTTRNLHRRDESIVLTLVDGPFRRLDGHWTFRPLGPDACKVEFVLAWEFRSTLLERLVGPAFGRIANSIFEAFVRRADQPAEPA